MPTSLEHKQRMLAHLQMQQVTADVCAEMFAIVAAVADADWAVLERGRPEASYILPNDLVDRAKALNAKLTAPSGVVDSFL